MTDFIRGGDPKTTLDIGVFKKIRPMMEESGFDYKVFWDVWKWALEHTQNWMFLYLVSFQGKKWIDGELIDLSDWNNELLWCSIEAENIEAVKRLLTYPNLFREEIFTMDQGVSDLKDEFIKRGETKVPMKATNFGAHLNLAIEHHPHKEIENMLREYYTKYSKNGL